MSTPCCYNNPYLSLSLGNCENFAEKWRKMANPSIPEGPSGNGTPKLSRPYGITPMPTPTIPYEPKTMSLNRTPWEGWRYGSNYVHTGGIERNYGFPDYQYYRQNYCGPCCPCVPGMNPPLVGDPNGKNPNVRYIPLDYKNLLGSGFAPVSQMSPFMMGGGNPGATTSCGQQPVKFQVCIGNQTKPETVQPMKMFLPLSTLPRGGPDGDQPDAQGNCGENNCESQDNCNTCPAQVPEKCVKEEAKPCKTIFDACGCCKACQVPKEFEKLKTQPLGRKKRQILTFPMPNNKNNKPLFIRPTEPPVVFNNETCC